MNIEDTIEILEAMIIGAELSDKYYIVHDSTPVKALKKAVEVLKECKENEP